MRQLLPGWIELKTLPFPMSLPGVARIPGKRCGLNLSFALFTSSRILLDISVHCESQMGVFAFLFRSFDAKTFQTEVTFLLRPAIVPHDWRRISFSSCFLYFFHFVDISWFLLGVKLASKLRWVVEGGWEKSTFRKARLVVVLSNQFLFRSLPSVHFFLY